MYTGVDTGNDIASLVIVFLRFIRVPVVVTAFVTVVCVGETRAVALGGGESCEGGGDG